MLNPYISCCVYAAEFLIFYIFYSQIGNQKYSQMLTVGIGLLLFETGSLINLISANNVAVNTIASILIKFIFSVICFDIQILIALCYSVLLDVLNFTLELAASFIFSALSGKDFNAYNNDLNLLLIILLTSKLLLFLTCLILSDLTSEKNTGAAVPFSLFFYPISATICMIIFWYLGIRTSENETRFLLSGVSCIMFLSTILLFITYQRQVEENIRFIRLKSEISRLETEKSYYDILEQQNQDLMVYAHDAKKHLEAIEALSQDPEITSYVVKLSDQLRNYSKNCHSGNKLLDVMVHKYVLDTAAKGLNFTYDIKSCNLKVLEDIDLVAILGNILDNAVSAAQNSTNKQLSLETTIRNNYSIIIVTNSCDTPPLTHGDKLVTTKKNRTMHGLGLQSVAKALKKYRGDYQWDYDAIHHQFIMTVMIGNPIDIQN